MRTNLPKILLVNPVTRDNTRVLRVERCQQKLFHPVGIWPPITLLEIAVYLKHNSFTDIQIIDGEIEGLSFDSLVDEIARVEPGIVVIQATTPTIDDDILLASRLKQKSNKIVTVFIGLHATVFPQDLLKNEAIDYVILGEPEEAVSELVSCLFDRKGSLGDIRGLGYRNNGSIFVNQKRTTRDNYDYPGMPDRSLLKNDKYIMPLTGRPFTVIKVSRGCDFNCAFCTSAAYYGKGWKARSPENIINEIKDVKGNYNIDTFLFLSDTFNGNKDFVDKLASLIIKENLNIKWVANSRVDLIDKESVALMRKAGCILVSLGIESYDKTVLGANRKYLTKQIIDRAVAILKKYGIRTYGYFIFGLEKENKISMMMTAVRAFKSKLDFAVFYSLTPYPGTDYFMRYNNRDWKDYFHGRSAIVGYSHLGKYTIKIFAYLALALFYLRPGRFILLVKYLLKRRLY